jgi:hypothetical protein
MKMYSKRRIGKGGRMKNELKLWKTDFAHRFIPDLNGVPLGEPD